AVEEICVTCGGAHPYYQCLASGGNTFPKYRDNIQGYVSAATCNYNQGPGTLQGNTIANLKGKLKAITTRSGLVIEGPTVPNPPKSVNPEEDECVEETYMDPDHAEYTIKVPPPPPLGLPDLILTRMTLELANRAICTLDGIARDVFVPVGEDSDFKDSIDQSVLANCDNLFVDLTPEMFADEQPPDYSFLPRFDVHPDDFLEIQSDANFDDDSFDSEREKIKEAELLIDPLDLPFKIITRVTQEKKLAVSFASWLSEDFDPPFSELLVFKEVHTSMRLLPFSSENEEKVSKPGIYTF
nr:hypothetical protein [Tanacetum cinerariifolium]